MSRNVVATIVLQLLDQAIEQSGRVTIDRMLRDSGLVDAESAVAFLSNHVKAAGTYYIIIDGLDACETDVINIVLESLDDLARLSPEQVVIKTFISGRQGLGSQILRPFPLCNRMSATPEQQEQDVSLFIEATLQARMQSGQLQLNDPNLILGIMEYLETGSQGM